MLDVDVEKVECRLRLRFSREDKELNLQFWKKIFIIIKRKSIHQHYEELSDSLDMLNARMMMTHGQCRVME